MIVACPSCTARFQYDESRFQGAPSKRFRCPKCQSVFEIPNPIIGTAPSQAPPTYPLAPTLGDGPFLPPTTPLPIPDQFPPKLIPTPASQVSALLPPPPPPTAPVRAQPAHVPNLGEDTLSLHAPPPRESTAPGAIPDNLRVSLVFLTGPHASTVRLISSPRLIIGREDGDVITRDPECSRRHAQMDIRLDGTVWITDLDSTNGTFVDGTQITTPTQLFDRQEFTCGRSTFMALIRMEELDGLL